MQSSVLKISIVLFLFNIIFPLTTRAVTFDNPSSSTTLEGLINTILNFIFYVGVTIFPIMAIIAGFLFLSSGGDSSKVKKAKDLLLYAVIGLFIILLAKAIVFMVKYIIGAQ